MITLIEGSIGGGKTYYAINDILRKYFKFDEVNNIWVKNLDHDIEVVTNIDGFHLGKDLNEEIEKAGGVDVFFTKDYLMKYTRDRKHIIVIDEAHEIFHRKYYNQEVFNMWKWHRHIGFDVYLITQEYKDLCRELQGLPEYHYSAVRRSFSLFGAKGAFRYQLLVGGKVFKTKIVKQDLRVFFAYKSSNIVQEERPKSVVFRYYIFIGCFILVGLSMFAWLLSSFASRSKVIGSGDIAKKENEEIQFQENKYKIVAVSGSWVFLQNGDKVKKMRTDTVKGNVKVGSFVQL
ncbi:MAG: zonular occludens toxin domain-containing protein [Candidatus Jettenia sp.]|nr:MAG: zonular occludens toxin domain-containing protein [Candidatus Jettenia sp.]